ncbi:MAG: hypothetical protein V3S19_05635, partial [Gemmatimonadales bacterium]
FWPYGLRRAGTVPGDILDLLTQAGFSLRAVPASLDEGALRPALTSPTTAKSVLAETGGEGFEQTMNLLAVRGETDDRAF